MALHPTRKPFDGADKRASAREGVLRQGQILAGNKSIFCAVHNLSAGGARLEVGVALPKQFDLMIAGHPDPVRAELKWQRGNYAGVAFRDALASADIDALRARQRVTPRSR